MIYKINHITKYEYDKKVFLEPHILRLYPRNDSVQKLHEFSYHIQPEPVDKSVNLDIDGNNNIIIWFDDIHKGLEITTTCKVETKRTNPFDFIVTDVSAIQLPVKYPKEYEIILKPYIVNYTKPTKKLVDFANLILKNSSSSTMCFLFNLSSYIHQNFEKTEREFGPPHPFEQTLKEAKGSCRDLTVLFMDACRIFGLATRFVSGYHLSDYVKEGNDLHAWAEVYLPGGGWRGYDPSLGLAVSSYHIALASGYHPSLAAPVSGTYRGDDVKAKISYEIKFEHFN
ncbi:MAG: transglutaminase family protein [Thermodesulfobacteriota bacterium]